MTFIVQYKRYFEEFGREDFDTEEFDNHFEAYKRYAELKKTTEASLWVEVKGFAKKQAETERQESGKENRRTK